MQSGSSMSSVARGSSGGSSSVEEEGEGHLWLGEAPCSVMPIIKTRSAVAAAESKLVPTIDVFYECPNTSPIIQLA